MSARLHNRLTSRVTLALWPLLVLLCCIPGSATTVLVILTPEGIVIAADSKVVSNDIGGYSAPPEGPTNKIIVIRDRIAVGTIGFGTLNITTVDDKPFFSYDPSTWLKGIGQTTAPDISVGRFAEIVEKKGQETFSALYQRLRIEGFTNEPLCNTKGSQYLVAGFESGTAVVDEVDLFVDQRNCQLTGPRVKSVFPTPITSRFDFGFHPASMGSNDSASDVVDRNTHSDGYRSIASEALTELMMLLAKRDLSLNQASTLLHAILRAQNRYTPELVGPPYSVVWLRKDGTSDRISYRD